MPVVYRTTNGRKIMKEEFDLGPDYINVRRRSIGKMNMGLPKGAIKCTDKEVIEQLEKMHIELIRLYLKTYHCINGGASLIKGYEIEESGLKNPTFSWRISPMVEGTDWYCGLDIKVEGGSVFVFVGSMQPWYEGGAPDYIVYSTAGVSRETILRAVTAYCTGILSHISEYRSDIKRRTTRYEADKAYDEAIAAGLGITDAFKARNKVYEEAEKKSKSAREFQSGPSFFCAKFFDFLLKSSIMVRRLGEDNRFL
jgi:hypothetical protein